MGNAIEINDSSFEKEVLQSSDSVLVDFWASWCAPCRTMSPIVDAVAGELSGKIKVAKLNVDENPITSAKYAVMSIPTFIVFKNGKEVDRITGFISQKNLGEKLRPYL